MKFFGLLRQRLIGAVLCLGALALGLGAAAPLIGPESPFMPIARLSDSMAPQILLLTGALGLGLAALGARWSGAVLALGAMTALGVLGAGHLRRSDPLGAGPVAAKVVFFNVLSDSPGREAQILAALRAADPDVVVLAEAGGFTTDLDEIRKSWPNVIGCEGGCELLIASRLPLRATAVRGLSVLWPKRYAQATVETPAGPFNLTAVHMAKPWTIGVSHAEGAMLARWLNIQQVPLVVVGDFNAAPWSAPLRQIIAWTGLRGVRWPVPTWPVPAGRFGVPIDNIFLRGGPRVVSLDPFGDDLGSNHRGFMARIALP